MVKHKQFNNFIKPFYSKVIIITFLFYLFSFENVFAVSGTTIDQATKCGAQTVYQDNVTIENAIGNDKYLDKTLGHSRYCPVYCVEENTFTFPGFKPEVESGNHFTWTIGETNEQNIVNGLTVQLTGKRNCRTKINLDLWEKDYKELLNKIESERKKLTASSSEITLCANQLGKSTFCGWHKIFEIEGYTPGKNGNATIWWHEMLNAAKSNYYLFYEAPVPGPGWIDWRDNGVVYNKIYQQWEAGCPCEEKLDEKYTQTTKYTKEDDPDLVAERKHHAKCNADYGSIGDNSTRIECKKHSKKVQTGSKCTFLSDSNGNPVYDENGNRKKTCKKIYTDYYWNTVTVYQRICDYSGMSITKDDLGKCYNTGIRKCPSGYHWADHKTMCYKTDTSYLERLLEDQQGMLDTLRECSSISPEYELDTKMSVDFEEPVYDKTIELTQVKTHTYSKQNHLVRAGSKSVTFYKCSLETAKKWCWTETKDITYMWISEYGKEFEVSYDYTLPKEMYQYVLLPSGKSVDNVPSSYGSSTTGFQNYINIGYSNYPVHYTTPKGLYNLDIVYDNIGYNNYFEQYVKASNPQSINQSGQIVYDCEYNVNNGEPFCPGGGCDPDPSDPTPSTPDDNDTNGVKLIYRPISLVTPFPGTDGSGRVAGSNWNNNILINKFILNNRNTSGNTIYNKEPMYQITLTPSRIKEIRTYNSKTTYDDFNLKCIKGYECKSEFIRESTLGFSTYFSGCGTGNWNACDKIDGFTR